MAQFPGIYVAVITPFTESQEVDYLRLGEHVDWLIANGVHGLVPTGSVGEYASLTDEERARVVETIIRTAAGRVPVVVGNAAPATARAIAWGRHARESGAVGIMALPPINYRPSRREVIAHFEALSTVGLPIIAYNNPVDYSTDLTPDLLADMAHIDDLVGVKEFSGDVRRIPAILDQTTLEVLVGVDDLVVEGFLAGATGWIAGMTNVIPRESVRLYDLIKAGSIDEANALYRDFLPLLRFDAQPYLVQAMKYACELVGHPLGPTRPPRLSLDDAVKRSIEQALARTHASEMVDLS
jgi:dihydrodipicolinate synthase/N-acetylneuraminate lyase